MKKKIKVTIKNKEQNDTSVYSAIYIPDQKVLKYQEKDKTHVTLNFIDNILIRENNTMYMEYCFQKDRVTDGVLRLKDIEKEFLLLVKTIKLSKSEKKYQVTYNLVETKESFTYIVEMEE